MTSRTSAEAQIALACDIIDARLDAERLFLFINVSAMHQPNCIFTDGAEADTLTTQADALAYVDRQLPSLFGKLQQRGPVLCILTSDHGTAYGEDGYWGHRLGHPVVWNVPYAEFVLPICEATP